VTEFSGAAESGGLLFDWAHPMVSAKVNAIATGQKVVGMDLVDTLNILSVMLLVRAHQPQRASVRFLFVKV
jgi:hypothetical protein